MPEARVQRGVRITIAVAPLIDGLPNPVGSKEGNINVSIESLAKCPEDQLGDGFIGLCMRGAERLWADEETQRLLKSVRVLGLS